MNRKKINNGKKKIIKWRKQNLFIDGLETSSSGIKIVFCVIYIYLMMKGKKGRVGNKKPEKIIWFFLFSRHLIFWSFRVCGCVYSCFIHTYDEPHIYINTEKFELEKKVPNGAAPFVFSCGFFSSRSSPFCWLSSFNFLFNISKRERERNRQIRGRRREKKWHSRNCL